jgi:hypothetical protein
MPPLPPADVRRERIAPTINGKLMGVESKLTRDVASAQTGLAFRPDLR